MLLYKIKMFEFDQMKGIALDLAFTFTCVFPLLALVVPYLYDMWRIRIGGSNLIQPQKPCVSLLLVQKIVLYPNRQVAHPCLSQLGHDPLLCFVQSLLGLCTVSNKTLLPLNVASSLFVILYRGCLLFFGWSLTKYFLY